MPGGSIFPHLTWDGDFRKGRMGCGGWKKWTNLYFPGLWTSQKNTFYLLSCLDRGPHQLGWPFSYRFPCSVTLAEDGEEGWKLIPAIMQGQRGGCSMGLGFETEMDPTWCFEDFRPWAEGTIKQSESWKFRKMCGSTWTLGQMLHFTTDMTYLRVL